MLLQASSGAPTTVKVDAYLLVKEGVWQWWATYSLQIDTDRQPEPVSSTAAPSSSGGGGGGNDGGDENRPAQPGASQPAEGPGGAECGTVVRGTRRRLLPLSESLQRALPGEGKITVLYGGNTCEAQLSLPCSDTK